MTGLARLRSIWRRGGAWAAARALRRRFLYQRWRSLLFAHPAPQDVRDPRWPDGYRYEWLGATADLGADRRATLDRSDLILDLAALASSDQVYAIWHGAEPVSCGVVMESGPQHSVLGLSDGACLIGLCETLMAHRRRGLFELGLVQTVHQLSRHGCNGIFVEVDPVNVASRAGIVKAGFELRGVVEAHIWFGAWVRRDGHWSRLVR